MTKTTFEQLLHALNFTQNVKQFSQTFANGAVLAADFANEKLIYPNGLIVHEQQTCNFSANENFVVFECVHRLLEKGYAPESIELEPKWKVGHGASGGRADILVKDRQGNSLLIIECKTAGNEYKKALKHTLFNGGQLFSYAQQDQSTQFLCLYASDFVDKKELKREYFVISLLDNEKIAPKEDSDLKRFDNAQDVVERFEVWKNTYQLEPMPSVIFEDTSEAYIIGKNKYTLADLKKVDKLDKEGKYHEFRTILRKYAVARRENAFEVLVNLFLCKIVDETQNGKPNEQQDLKFYWKGIAYDSYFELVDRLQSLYKTGMESYLKQDIVYVSDKEIDDVFWAVKNGRNSKNATKTAVFELFTKLKYYKGLDFEFVKVHNKKMFEKNAKILIEVVRMWQDLRLKTDEQNQFLGDMFEYFLDNGVKQSEGQFFTPMPICRFILMALPLENVITENEHPPKTIDYACGAGHFLNEYAAQIKPFVLQHKEIPIADFYAQIVGIEKEDRLAKVAKVSAFMYGQDAINIIDADALANHDDVKANSFNILVANPPFAVESFLETLDEKERDNYELLKTVSDVTSNKNIQCFFIERAMQLLAPHGLAAIIVPSSVLSNSDATHVGSREILLKHFDIVALVELGSGTFGKTGTNTVVLFLRRKHKNPTEAEQYFNRVNDWFDGDGEADVYEDLHFIHSYCEHIGIAFEQYETLLNGKPSAELLAHEMFVDYKKHFDSTKQKSFLTYLRNIEKDKLFYFVLAYENPQKVLVIKSPSDNKAQKVFLGYEWSDRKGAEGIQLAKDSNENHVTPLYDETNRDNPEKINTLITQNFLGNLSAIPENLQPFASLVNLVDMLDFSRKDFDKTISLNVKKLVEIESKYKTFRLGDFNGISEFINGYAFKSENLLDKKIIESDLPVIKIGNIKESNQVSFDRDCQFHSIKNVEHKIVENGDLVIALTGATVGKAGWVKEKSLLNQRVLAIKAEKFVLQYISIFICSNLFYEYAQQTCHGNAQGNLSPEKAKDFKIPLPPLDIQQQIVNECEAIDGEVEKANLEIQTAKTAIDETVQRCFNGGFVLEKLEKVLALEYGKPLPEKQRVAGEFPVMGSNGISGYHNEFLVEAPAIIVGRKGSAGKVVYIEKNCFPIDTTFYVKPIKPCAMKYLYYILLAMELEKMIKGIGVPGINRNDVYQLQIPVPNLETQQTLVTQIETFEKQIDDAQKVIDDAAGRKTAVLRKFL
jgi:type I restriction-modification system DNA methylase subunit/restriction endonuclease S subunit